MKVRGQTVDDDGASGVGVCNKNVFKVRIPGSSLCVLRPVDDR